MLLRDVIRAKKTMTDWGKWDDGANMTRASFPLSKPRNPPLPEFHGTHPGWHLLASCDCDGTPPGVMRFPGQRRMPAARGIHRKKTFGIKNDAQALEKAAKFFRLHKSEDSLV